MNNSICILCFVSFNCSHKLSLKHGGRREEKGASRREERGDEGGVEAGEGGINGCLVHQGHFPHSPGGGCPKGPGPGDSALGSAAWEC